MKIKASSVLTKPAKVAPINFGDLAKKQTEKAKNYPVASETKEITELVDRIVERDAKLKTLESQQDTDKEDLSQILGQDFYEANHNGDEAESIIARGNKGECLMTQTKRFRVKDINPKHVKLILGKKTDKYFSEVFEIKVDSSLVADSNQQKLVDGIQKLAKELGCLNAVSVKREWKPNAGFHLLRHRELDVETNVELDEACPPIRQIRVR